MFDRQVRERIQALEERAMRRDRETAEFSARLSRGEADFARLAATVEAIRASRAVPSPAVSSIPPTPAPSAPSVSATKPRKAPSSAVAPDRRPPVPPAPRAPPTAPSAVALAAVPAGFASLIVADFPALFAEFSAKRFTLLWRGSRDGFGARDFHGRCDGHAPTLPLIQDTGWSVFGGFTPVAWESRKWNRKKGSENNCQKADPNLKSFLFTLKNPRGFPARRFALKAKGKDEAIYCNSSWGPHFNDMGVSDHCNANMNSYSCLGGRYANDTDLDGETVLTGSWHFTGKEIEVFEITD
jgi:hypothetical protein